MANSKNHHIDYEDILKVEDLLSRIAKLEKYIQDHPIVVGMQGIMGSAGIVIGNGTTVTSVNGITGPFSSANTDITW